jgi:hypothetical protein
MAATEEKITAPMRKDANRRFAHSRIGMGVRHYSTEREHTYRGILPALLYWLYVGAALIAATSVVARGIPEPARPPEEVVEAYIQPDSDLSFLYVGCGMGITVLLIGLCFLFRRPQEVVPPSSPSSDWDTPGGEF